MARGETRLLMVGCLAVLALAACGSGGDGQGRASSSPDTVVVVLNLEPEILNIHLPDGNLPSTQAVTAPVLAGAFRVTPSYDYEPVLVEDATVTEEPFTVTYRIREEAVWDDGTAVSAEDFAFTWRTFTDPGNDVFLRDGYERITDVDIVDDKTVTFHFGEPYPAWRELFSQVLPAHVLEGADFDQVWTDELTAASGPFAFGSWERGVQLTLVRNERWWGPRPALDRVVFRFAEDVDTVTRMLTGQEADLANPVPTDDLVERLDRDPALTLETALGTQWEHLAFNLDQPLLGRAEVRKAIARGLDRALIAEQLLRPIHPDLVPLDSVFFVPDQASYRATWAPALRHDPAEAVRLLEEAGCTRPEGGIASCDGERLELRYTTVAGDLRREQLFEIVQAQLAEVGIAVTADFAEPAVLFGERLPEGRYDAAAFAWFAGPDPEGGVSVWRCDGELNFTAYCDPEVDALLEEARQTLDPGARAELFHEADARIAEAVPAVPLFQAPSLLVWRDGLEGPTVNPTSAGPTWNIEDWRWRP